MEGGSKEVTAMGRKVVGLWYALCHTIGMKVALSIPDPLFEEAEELAKRLGTSRSGLYRKALESYVRGFREEELIRRINDVCADVDTTLPPEQARAAGDTLSRVEWEE